MAKRQTKRSPRDPGRRSPARRGASAAGPRVPLRSQHLLCVDGIIASVKRAGGPAFTREQVVHALIEAALGRRFDARSVRSATDLRVALGGLDLSAVEKMLRERPRLESGLLKALEDSIK